METINVNIVKILPVTRQVFAQRLMGGGMESPERIKRVVGGTTCMSCRISNSERKTEMNIIYALKNRGRLRSVVRLFVPCANSPPLNKYCTNVCEHVIYSWVLY